MDLNSKAHSLFDFETSLHTIYHENSKFRKELKQVQKPKNSYDLPIYNNFSNYDTIDIAPKTQAKENLPQVTFQDLIKIRRSPEKFELKSQMDIEELAHILDLASGVTAEENHFGFQIKKRAYPSAGALYPIEIFFYAHKIQGLEKGIYHYCPFRNQLFHLKKIGMETEDIERLFFGADEDLEMKENYWNANCFFFLHLNLKNALEKYGDRAYRLALKEAGHLMQNLILASCVFNYQCKPLDGYYDDEINHFIDEGLEEFFCDIIYVGLLGKVE